MSFLCRRRLYGVIRLIQKQKLVFVVGVLIGVALAIIVHFLQDPDHVLSHFHLVGLASVPFSKLNIQQTLSYLEATYNFTYERWLDKTYHAQSTHLDPDWRRFSTNLTSQVKDEASVKAAIEAFVNETTFMDPRNEAHFLYETIPVVCLVFPTNGEWAEAVQNTWGRHCNKIHFFSHQIENETYGIHLLPATSEFSLLCQAFQIILKDEEEISNKNFWTVVATQDTYVLVENLRYFVAPFNQSGEFYIGHAMRFWNAVYNWIDAGFALSKPALQKLIGLKFPDRAACEAGGKHWKNGDWYLGRHLHDLGIKPMDTRDHAGRGRFNGYSLKKLLFPGGVSMFERYWRDSLYLSTDGPHCCSNYAITFHGVVSKSKMYQLEYLYYHLRPFHAGGSLGNRPPPTSKRDSKAPYLTWEEKLKADAMAKMFDFKPEALMTTPKNMDLIMRQDAGGLR